MKHCCSSPGVPVQLLQVKVVHAHHFHRCCCVLRSPSGSPAKHGGHSQTGKTRLGCFSAYCRTKPILLLSVHEDSTGHNWGLCFWKCPWFISSDCHVRYTYIPTYSWHYPLGQSDLPAGQQSLITLFLREADGVHLDCSSISSVFSGVLCCKPRFAWEFAVSKLQWLEQKMEGE